MTGRNQAEAFYIGTCFALGSVLHFISVGTKCCQLPALQAAQHLQRNQTSKPEATGRLSLPLPQREELCASLLRRHSLPLSTACVHQALTPLTTACVHHPHFLGKRLWETQLCVIEKGLKYSYEKSCLFYFHSSIIYVYF